MIWTERIVDAMYCTIFVVIVLAAYTVVGDMDAADAAVRATQ